MESDRTIYYTLKYSPFAIGIFFILMPLVMYLDPEHSTFNGEPGPPDIWATVTMVLIGMLIVLIPFLYIDELVIVQLTHDNIFIAKGTEVIEAKWTDVESIKMLPVIFPPLYKMRLKNYDGYFLFNTKRWGIQFLIFVWDWSEMGALIARKKKQLGL